MRVHPLTTASAPTVDAAREQLAGTQADLATTRAQLAEAVALLDEVLRDDYENACLVREGPDDEEGIPTAAQAPQPGCDCAACRIAHLLAAQEPQPATTSQEEER
jgi:hypothetical protein